MWPRVGGPSADHTVPYKYTARIQKLLPHSELIAVEGGGHDLAVSHPETIVSALMHFVVPVASFIHVNMSSIIVP
jgi:pimeloyl-ACP methyl ester carboxylesterase